MPIYLCNINDINDNDGKGFELQEGIFFAVKKAQKLYIYVNRCPHNGLPLDWQPDQFLDLDKENILCSSHGALFKIEDGECFAGPCLTKKLSAVSYFIEADKVYIKT